MEFSVLAIVALTAFTPFSIANPALGADFDAVVSDCSMKQMLPYVRSGLRELAAAALYKNQIETYPADATVTDRGPIADQSGILDEEAFEVHVTTKAGAQIRVYSSDQNDLKWLTIGEPKIENRLDDDGQIIGRKCVAYVTYDQPRTLLFIEEQSGQSVLKDEIPADPLMLAWVAIQ